jgi:hypothetical protein
MAPCKTELSDFLAGYQHVQMVYVTVRIVVPGDGLQRLSAQIFVQEGRKIILTIDVSRPPLQDT